MSLNLNNGMGEGAGRAPRLERQRGVDDDQRDNLSGAYGIKTQTPNLSGALGIKTQTPKYHFDAFCWISRFEPTPRIFKLLV